MYDMAAAHDVFVTSSDHYRYQIAFTSITSSACFFYVGMKRWAGYRLGRFGRFEAESFPAGAAPLNARHSLHAY